METLSVLSPHPFNATVDLVDRSLQQGWADRTLFLFRDKTITYDRFAALVNRCANAMVALGVKPGQRVALVLPDSPLSAALFFGIVRMGGVALPLPPMAPVEEYRYLLENSEATAIVGAHPMAAAALQATANTPTVQIVLEDSAENGFPELHRLLAGQPAAHTPAPTRACDPAYWNYTSGSTGRPKGVVKSHFALAHKGDYAYCEIDLRQDDKVYSLAKLFVDYGIHNITATLRHGISQVLDPQRPTASGVAALLTQHRPTIFMGIPTILAQLLTLPTGQVDFSSVRHCKVGAEPLPAALFEEFKQRFGIEPLEIMGTSETGGELLKTRPGKVRPGALGQPNEGRTLKLVDDNLDEVPSGTTGRLMVNDPARASGYWNAPDQTAAVFRGDWVLTSDLFVRDEDDYFWFKGRVDDVLDVGGRKVVPQDIEGVLRRHPAVADCGVIGFRDESGLTKPKAFVVLRASHKPAPHLADELKAFVKTTIAPYNYPRQVVFVESLPRTSLGKLERHKLEEMP